MQPTGAKKTETKQRWKGRGKQGTAIKKQTEKAIKN
jgi:hypothetical protein